MHFKQDDIKKNLYRIIVFPLFLYAFLIVYYTFEYLRNNFNVLKFAKNNLTIYVYYCWNDKYRCKVARINDTNVSSE